MESAQGQELKRMGKTAITAASIASIPFGLKSLYYNPLATGASIGAGSALS
jgi:hypothetical protein